MKEKMVMDMKTFSVLLAAFAFVSGAFAGEAKPYTHLNYLDDPEEFRFAIIPDRFGADYRSLNQDYRGGFTNAIRVVNLLRPNFVMSVGDLIPMGWLGESVVNSQHKKLKSDLKEMVPPFYYVVGNHDNCPSIDKPGLKKSSEISTKVWKEQWGKDTYYSFVYRGCLFVALNCIDGITLEAKHKDISNEQYAWFEKTLKAHSDVRWTFIFMHLPSTWTSQKWLDFELKHLVKRDYTVFAGDWHHYLHVKRHNRDYYVLATAGGGTGGGFAGQDMDKRGVLFGRDHGELDHVMWVTMTRNGPVIANIDVTGVLNHDFVNQKTTKSLSSASVKTQLEYPKDPETAKSMAERRKRREQILAGKLPVPKPGKSE
jgi:hypothetical protein